MLAAHYRCSLLQKQEIQTRAAAAAGGGQVLDQRERLIVFALTPGRPPSVWRAVRRPQIGHEQGRFVEPRELLEAGQHVFAGEKRGGVGGRSGSVPVKEPRILTSPQQPFEQPAGGGGEGGIRRRTRFRLRETRGDCRLDLLGEIEVVPGEAGKERVDEMEPAQVVAADHFFGFPRLLISSMNSETSRNSLYTLAKRT